MYFAAYRIVKIDIHDNIDIIIHQNTATLEQVSFVLPIKVQTLINCFPFYSFINICQVRYIMDGNKAVNHYDDVIMTMLASQISSLPVVCSIVYSDVNQRKHQSSASLAFVREIHRGPVNFPHKWPVTRKMFPFDDVIMCLWLLLYDWCHRKCVSSKLFSYTSLRWY